MGQDDVQSPSVDVQREADGVTVFTVTPEAGPEDVVRAFAAFMREGPTSLVLWDLRQGSFRPFTDDELPPITLSSATRAPGRSAFVVPDNADRDVLRTLITYAWLSGHVVSLLAFGNVDVARAWLLGRAS